MRAVDLTTIYCAARLPLAAIYAAVFKLKNTAQLE
jgi:hypothetical protein